jgi:hypothetical protein
LAMTITSSPPHYGQLSATTAVLFFSIFSFTSRRKDIATDTAANEDLNK